MPRTRSVRDAVLVLVGALCMHIATSFFGAFQPDLFAGDVATHSDTTLQDSHHPSVQTSHHGSQGAVQKQTPILDTSVVDVAYDFPETTIEAHAPGWTVFRNLYMSNGTLFVVSPHPASEFPDIKFITSTGLPAENTPENIAARMPTSKDLDFITPAQARLRWGVPTSQTDDKSARNRVYSVQGSTFLFNDPQQFLDHYYHFCAELLLGTWAFWQGAFNVKVDPRHSELTTAPPVTRALFPHADANGWRDRPGFNSYFLRAAFPSLTVEVAEDWHDRVAATSMGGEHARAWHFDTVLLTDRSAAFRGVICGTQVHRTAGEAFHHMRKLGRLSKWWWEPVRRAVLRFADIDEHTLDIGVRAAEQAEKAKSGVAVVPGAEEKIVITYIDRQGVRRHLIDEDHERLVDELTKLCTSKGWELNVVKAERLTKEEQLSLVARTTVSDDCCVRTTTVLNFSQVLLGVHGNGLTVCVSSLCFSTVTYRTVQHLIMMSPTPISTVIEMFFPGGFAHDYEWTARALGHKHFAIWNDTCVLPCLLLIALTDSICCHI